MTFHKNTSTTIKKLLFVIVFGSFFGMASILISSPVYATHRCAPGTPNAGRLISHTSPEAAANACGGPSEEQAAAEGATLAVECKSREDSCSINERLSDFIKILSLSVGIVVVIMVAWGGLQYTASRDNPGQVGEARNHIQNAVIALFLYIFMVAILNFIVPGGVF